MRIGVICEGHSDRAVIENIIKGIIDIDRNDIVPLRPQNLFDETDKHIKTEIAFSNWSLVKKECEEKELIRDFLSLDGDFVIIHLDTAEADEYSVGRPAKNDSHEYCELMRKRVVEKVDEWLNDEEIIDKTIHAIAIEETDAWILAIYYNRDSCFSAQPKEKLKFELRKRNISSITDYDNYKVLSDDFTSEKKVRRGNYLDRNCSLYLFIEELKGKIL